MCGALAKVRFGPKADSCTATIFYLISGDSTHIHGTDVLVEEPSTASEADLAGLRMNARAAFHFDCDVLQSPGIPDSRFL
jgi:hypothetical protein